MVDLSRDRDKAAIWIETVAGCAPMDLNLLALFTTVAEASSFSTAAAKLGVRRSSVSRGIAALERSLGVQLFSRTTRRVALTTAGAALLSKVAPAVQALEEAVGSLPEREAEPSGELRLTAPNDIGTIVLPALCAGFALRYPAVRLDVHLTNRFVDLVAEGLDAALRISVRRLSDSSLVARKLSELETHIYAAPTYLARKGTPRGPEDAPQHTWVSLRGESPLSSLSTLAAEPSMMSDDVLFLREAVISGLGLGALPTFLARDALGDGRLVRVLPRHAVRVGALYFVHPPATHLSRKLMALRDYLVAHFSAHPLATHLKSGAP